MAFSLIPLGVIAYSLGTVLLAETLQYLFIYSKPEFKKVQQNLAQHSKKVEEAVKDGTSTKGLKKREARREKWREEASKYVAAMNFKTTIITVIMLFISLRMVPRLFGTTTVARLPFVPPPFLQKLTHRGLSGADPTECSALFIFMLCQASFRTLVPGLLGWGPSREMKKIKPWVPKEFRTEE